MVMVYVPCDWQVPLFELYDTQLKVTRVPPHDGISARGCLTSLRTSAWEVSVIANCMTFTRRAFQYNVNVSRLIFDC